MKKNLLQTIAILLLLNSCNNSIQKTDKDVAEQSETVISNDTATANQNIASGISAKISFDQHFYKEDCTSRDAFLKSPDRENMFWPGDTTRCSSIDITTIKISIENNSVAEAINKSIEDSICNLLNQYTQLKYQSIAECLTAVKETGYLSYGCTVKAVSNVGNIICIEIKDRLWVGGAHDTWERYIYCNYSLLTGKVLKLNDIVSDKYSQQFNSIAKKLFLEKYSKKVTLGEHIDANFKLSNASFEIKNEGFLFKFHEGVFGPNSDGVLEILVPFKDIKPFLSSVARDSLLL
jgi:hypothetical protein